MMQSSRWISASICALLCAWSTSAVSSKPLKALELRGGVQGYDKRRNGFKAVELEMIIPSEEEDPVIGGEEATDYAPAMSQSKEIPVRSKSGIDKTTLAGSGITAGSKKIRSLRFPSISIGGIQLFTGYAVISAAAVVLGTINRRMRRHVGELQHNNSLYIEELEQRLLAMDAERDRLQTMLSQRALALTAARESNSRQAAERRQQETVPRADFEKSELLVRELEREQRSLSNIIRNLELKLSEGAVLAEQEKDEAKAEMQAMRSFYEREFSRLRAVHRDEVEQMKEDARVALEHMEESLKKRHSMKIEALKEELASKLTKDTKGRSMAHQRNSQTRTVKKTNGR